MLILRMRFPATFITSTYFFRKSAGWMQRVLFGARQDGVGPATAPDLYDRIKISPTLG